MCTKKILFVLGCFSSSDKILLTSRDLRVADIFLHLVTPLRKCQTELNFMQNSSLTFIVFPFSLGILYRMVGVAVEGSFFFEIHQVEPVLSIQVIITQSVLTVVIQVEEIVDEEKVICGVLPSKFK